VCLPRGTRREVNNTFQSLISNQGTTQDIFSNTTRQDQPDTLHILDMTTEEIEESQSGIEDGGVGGPGAPTPLSALEVSLKYRIAPRRD
jgi:hypothetical protein